MHKFVSLLAVFTLMASPLVAELTLEEALRRGLSHSLGLQAACLDIAIKEAEAYQVSLFPNPDFSADADDMGVLHPVDDCPVYAFGLSQLIELGGKRCKRRNLANAFREVAEVNYALKRHLLLCDIEETFVWVSQLQAEAAIAQAKRDLEEKMHNASCEKANEGKLARSEKVKSEAKKVLRDFEIKKKLSELEQAKLDLAYLMGSTCLDFEYVENMHEEVSPVTVEEACASLELLLKGREIHAAYQAMCLEKAKGVPDLFVRAGLVCEEDFCRTGAFGGFTIALPIFDRNQGNYARASYEASKLELEEQQLCLDLELEMRKKKLAIENAYEEAICFKEEIWKRAQAVCHNAQESYQNGKIEYVCVLEEEWNCLEVQEKYIGAVTRFHELKLELKKMAGQPFGGS